MELQVTVTLSDRFFSLLEDKLPNLGKRVHRAISKELGAQVRKESSVAIEAIKIGAETGNAETAESAESAGTAEAIKTEIVKAEAEKAPEAEAKAEPKAKHPTGEDIRAAIDRTRKRFEGEDYKENTNGEGYKKYHRALAGIFRQIAMQYGADKPSLLAPDRRAEFIAECEALELDENGVIATRQAPY